MAAQLSVEAGELGIRYFLVTFTDLQGEQRAKLVPTAAIDAMIVEGAPFAGAGAWLDLDPADPELFVRPDANSLIQLPWKPSVGWLAGDPWLAGAPLARAPRNVLKAQVAKANDRRVKMKSRVECEFFIVNPDGDRIADPLDRQERPAFNQAALMRRYDLLTEVCQAMILLGWDPDQIDHAEAGGQYRMSWVFDDALVTADRHVFFRFMVESIAEKHDLRASFSGGPFAGPAANHCPVQIALFRGEINQFLDAKGALGLSKLAHGFMGGVTHAAEALTALLNPTVSSYDPAGALRTVSLGGDDRTRMIRIARPGWFELRMADGAVNPYLLQAGALCAGLDGVAQSRDPAEGADRPLPANLLDALTAFETCEVLEAGLGEFSAAYLKLKHAEWRAL
jgi:glutamine synthetase